MKRTTLKRGKPLRRKSKSKSAQWREQLLAIWYECIKRMYGWREVVKENGETVLAGKCWWCGQDTTSTGGAAHHIFSQGNYPAGRYLLANGRAICNPCHFSIHKGEKRPEFDATVVEEIGGEAFVELRDACTRVRGSYNAVQFERDLRDLNDKLVTLGGSTE